MILGYHASHEQSPPEVLLGHVQAAERAGFEHAMCSDHVSPFLPEQGHSGHAWTWLGAALQSTGMTMGPVTAPGYRYNPVVVAQAAATLARMFPGRTWLALGSGEALNEHITGDRWPDKHERNERLRACHDIMQALWSGRTVSRDAPVRVDRARLWSLPDRPPQVFAAAMGPETAAFVAPWSDGLITVDQPPERLEQIVRAYRDNGGEGKPMHLQVQLSWHEDEEEALRIAHDQWRFSAMEPEKLETLETPEEIAEAAESIRPPQVRAPVAVVTDLEALDGRIRTWGRLGFARAYLHHVGPDQRAFIAEAAKKLLRRTEAPPRA